MDLQLLRLQATSSAAHQIPSPTMTRVLATADGCNEHGTLWGFLIVCHGLVGLFIDGLKTIKVVIFDSYVKLPEVSRLNRLQQLGLIDR